MKEKLLLWSQQIENKPIFECIEYVMKNISGKKVFSTSFGIEDQLLTYYLLPFAGEIEAFTLDTGRQFNETYEVYQKTSQKYPELSIKTYFPDPEDVSAYVSANGINGFYDTIENRKQCCYIRKVKPLEKAIEGAVLWITGMRSEQSVNREKMSYLEWDESRQIIKFNPLLTFTLDEVESQVEKYKIPVNSLYKKGYVSIGCAPCTRATEPGEDFRAGRWWWESSKKECGLHVQPLKGLSQ